MKSSTTHPFREIGVDISKDRLDLFDGQYHWHVNNTKAGITELLKRLAKSAPLATQRLTCESTGRYGHLLISMSLKAGLPISVANPRAVRDFARATGKLAKTDRIDAALIVRYATAIQPAILDESWHQHEAFGQLHGRMHALIVQRSAQKASLHQYHNPVILKEINNQITDIDRRITRYEKQLDALIADSSSMAARRLLMTEIKGVGQRTSLALLATMPELGSLNRKQAAALAGLAPINRDSGTLRGRRTIQGGRDLARSALYQAALSASRYHPTLSVFYRRLRDAGKPARLAFCAVARKLLIQINTALKPVEQPALAIT